MLTIFPSQIEQNIHAWSDEVDHDRRQLLVVMQKIQDCYQSISEESMRALAKEFEIQPAEVLSLATFFTSFCIHPRGKYTFKVCRGLTCDMQQKEETVAQIQKLLGLKVGETSLDGLFSLEFSQCMGMCDQGPVLSVNNQVFPGMTPQKLETIISFCKQGRNVPPTQSELASLALWEGRSETPSYPTIPPGSVLSRLSSYSPEMLLDELVKNRVLPEDLPAQLNASSRETVSQRQLVCNTDLPQAGSFVERILLADHYDLFLEGMLACIFLSDAREGIIYLRPEYEGLRPVLTHYLERLNDLAQSEALPSSGRRSGCSIEIRISPGFVGGGVGKSLNTAVNSDRFAANGASSLIRVDVQTLVEIGRYLIQKGSGKAVSTRIYAVSGDCGLPGVYELPINTTVNDLLEISKSYNPKAVQVGRRFVPPSQFSTPIEAGSLSEGTSIIVYGENTDFNNVAATLLRYSAFESCGQCVPCREGSARLVEKFRTMQTGRKFSVLELNSIADSVRLASKCEFGQNAVTAFQSLVQCYRELA